MKKILVEGYANSNLGDDLFFTLLVNRYKKIQFIFNIKHETKLLKSFTNVITKHYQLVDLLIHIYQFDYFVVIGGSLFQQSKGKAWFKWWLGLWLKVLLFKIQRKKVIFMGFNFGPYYSKTFFLLFKFLFYQVDYLSVRDNETLNLFKKNKKVHLFPDMVFSLPNIVEHETKRRSLAVSVMDFGPEKTFQKSYEEFLIKIINGISSDIDITLYGFQVSSTVNDEAVINRIKSRVNHPVSFLCYDENNIDSFLMDYSKNFFSITCRFHSLILSLKAKQQIISIDYNIKVGSLLKTLKIQNMNVQVNEFNDKLIIDKIIKKINKAEVMDNNYLSNDELENIIAESSKHFSYLDDLIRTTGK
ncbi:polysaccharide pyruvyl transferase family protein [Loigolactobacillus jiayinensis]|uniref:Polysaccharide pyruvyl transferase family protein n=1 Tax=Loigolactobacillus jiayinensis TaxID=2486016 RepID=A0ABW1R941_9LACO|nr:polysaccharide pyruvyl transferase family protein [Loigolactobacillus jiayinensis]